MVETGQQQRCVCGHVLSRHEYNVWRCLVRGCCCAEFAPAHTHTWRFAERGIGGDAIRTTYDCECGAEWTIVEKPGEEHEPDWFGVDAQRREA